MKSICLILVTLCSNFLAQAQNEFAPLGAKWTYSIAGVGSEPTSLEVIDIQIINGKKMKKLLSVGNKGCAGFAEWIYEENGKVYQYFNQKSYLLYDFNAKKGDSWKVIYDTPNYKVDSLLIKVDSVATINTALGVKKVQYISAIKNTGWGNGNFGEYIIEGIGFNDYFFPHFGLCDSSPNVMRCYIENGVTVKFVNYDCYKTISWIGTKEKKEESILYIYPNPTSGLLHIDMRIEPTETMTWELFDSYGQLVFHQALHELRLDINLPLYLPKGIYFWRVLDKQNVLEQGKIVLLE
jgi:hypothetical protein